MEASFGALFRGNVVEVLTSSSHHWKNHHYRKVGSKIGQDKNLLHLTIPIDMFCDKSLTGKHSSSCSSNKCHGLLAGLLAGCMARLNCWHHFLTLTIHISISCVYKAISAYQQVFCSPVSVNTKRENLIVQGMQCICTGLLPTIYYELLLISS